MSPVFIFIENANVILSILRSNTNGLSNPNSWPNDSHHSPFTLDAKSPSNPPITSPLNININNIQKLLSFIAIFFLLCFPYGFLRFYDFYIISSFYFFFKQNVDFFYFLCYSLFTIFYFFKYCYFRSIIFLDVFGTLNLFLHIIVWRIYYENRKTYW